jgi:hypothetical protein
MIPFTKHDGYYVNKEYDFMIAKNEEAGDWDMYIGDDWAGDAKTKRELVAWATRMADAHNAGWEKLTHLDTTK